MRVSDILVASSLTISFFTKCVMVQNNSNIVPALNSADIEFTAIAMLDGSLPAKFTKNLAASMNIGLPGG